MYQREIFQVQKHGGAIMHKHCAFCPESTTMTGCADVDTSMNIRYTGIFETDAEREKFQISGILI